MDERDAFLIARNRTREQILANFKQLAVLGKTASHDTLDAEFNELQVGLDIARDLSLVPNEPLQAAGQAQTLTRQQG